MDWQKLDIWPRGKAGTDRLVNEMARKPVEEFSITEGVLTVVAEFDKDELPEAVKEMAIIAGGTEDPGTGTTYGYARVNREGKEPQLVVGRWTVECGG